MDKYLINLITFSLIFLIVSCQKDNYDACLGCGIDTSPKEFEFEISGTLYSNCQGEPASSRSLEFNISDKENTFLGTTLTDINGNFNFTYKLTLEWPYNTSLAHHGFTILKIADDSIEYILPSLANVENLNLTLTDSIHLNVYLEYTSEPLLAMDTLFYKFTPKELYGEYNTYDYKIGGPIANHDLINQINSKWGKIEIDENVNPILNVYWKVERYNNTLSPHIYSTKSTKTPCIIKNDSVTINLE